LAGVRFSRRAAAPLILAGVLAGCSPHGPAPTGPLSREGAGKASFTEAKAIEKVYHAGYTGISMTGRDADGVWRGLAARKRDDRRVAVSVTENGPVVAGEPPSPN
jgi:hypothetical protein